MSRDSDIPVMWFYKICLECLRSVMYNFGKCGMLTTRRYVKRNMIAVPLQRPYIIEMMHSYTLPM